ncbi:MAG: glycine/betaine ABC transporter permease, partial [Gammaproteobacteria bacterium]|nr:glycine/betaine ABC transporter permease [Gammaproteobacteria bacterium]
MNSVLARDYRGLWPWLAVIGITLVSLLLRDQVAWLSKLPGDMIIPVSSWINLFMDWFVSSFKWLFRSLNWLLSWPMSGAQGLLQWLPWPATIAGFCTIAWVASGWRLSVFTGLALFYMVATGHWEPSMNTLGIVFVSIPLAVAVGAVLAIGAYNSARANSIIQPILDLMQTVPTFAYLIPILLLFGFGPVVGVVAGA